MLESRSFYRLYTPPHDFLNLCVVTGQGRRSEVLLGIFGFGIVMIGSSRSIMHGDWS